jgi:hypothetical protein
MDGDDGVAAVVLAAENSLGFGRVDLEHQRVEALEQLLGDVLALLAPLEQHGKIVFLLAQRGDQRHLFLEAATALQDLLCVGLVLPEIRGRRALFEPGYLIGRPS